MSISLPQTFTITPISKDPNHARVEISPLHPGYGHTVGNALRRVLLSSLQGAGITSVKINNADHEFMSLPHIKEEVLEIILNLKEVNLKLHGNDKEKIVLDVKGKKQVTAGDFKSNPNVEIANKDQLIATLTHKDAVLQIEAAVAKGLGFSPLEERDKELEVGVISIDTLFSPIQVVGYTVENTRVGKRTDFDKLIFDIKTDGAITVEEAMKKASEILVEQFKVIHDQIKVEKKDNKIAKTKKKLTKKK